MSNDINVVQHNLAAMFANRQLGITTNTQKKSSEKLSSGYRINRAADDAAGLAISEKMRWQIRGLQQGTKNTQDGVSWCQIGDGAMHELHDMLQRMNELAVKAANDTLQDTDREYINSEVQALKKEINRVGGSVTFNEKLIFDNETSMLSVDGTPDDVQIFDASYDKQSGDVAFGGVIFDGKRVPWSDIDGNMVTTDADGNQIFNAGDYNYTSDGKTFQFHCEDGAAVPDMTRTLSIKADTRGISVDGELIPWNKVYDEQGNPCTGDTIDGTGVSFDYHGAEVSLGLSRTSNSKDAAITAINHMGDEKVRYIWETNYVGNSDEQAVDVLTPLKDIQISSGFAQKLIAGSDVAMTVECDKTGIRLKDSSGNLMAGSDKTWADLGISDWMHGSDISDTITYVYPPAGDTLDPDISISFNLSEVTSVDSVIDGLNGMTIDKNGIRTSYKTTADNADGVLKSFQPQNGSGINVNFEEEYQLGRNFDMQDGAAALKKDSVVTYTENEDGTKVTAGIAFQDASGNNVITLTGDATDIAGTINSALKTYWGFAEKLMKAATMNGFSVDTGDWSLEKLVGDGNITTTGFLTEDLKLTSGYQLTDGDKYYKPGVPGMTYASAHINFNAVADLDQLLGLGFDSTCATCDNHYSVAFVDHVDQPDRTSTGIDFQRRSMGSRGQDYQLYIGIDSLKAANVTPGTLAEKLVDITSECFDFHFQQYAAKDGQLYVYDNRSEDLNYCKHHATFNTKPHYDVSSADFALNLNNADGDAIKLNYHCDLSETKDQIDIQMEADNVNGEFVSFTDGGTTRYKRYDGLSDAEKTEVDAAIDSGDTRRYNMTVQYKYTDAEGNQQQTTDRDAAMRATAVTLAKQSLTQTTVTIEAQDYSYLSVKGDEKPNIAVRANYESNVRLEGEDNGIRIQHSSTVDDFTTIPRFPMNTVVMGIFGTKTDPRDAALKAIGQVKKAMTYVSEKRSVYGAMQNRLEHTINNNRNKEENTQAAESLIRDTNMSEEMVRFSNANIIAQAGQSMLAQANQTKQGVLSLLQ